MNGIQGAGWGYGQASQTGKTNRSAKADERLKELQEKGLSAEQAEQELEKEENVEGLRDTYEKSKNSMSQGEAADMRAKIVSALTAGNAEEAPAISYSKEYGKVVGDVKLSDEAKKVYDELKDKFHGMDFVLVDTDQKEAVSKNAARYGSAGKTTVLIDEEKLEKMAQDPAYKEKVIGTIEQGQKKLEEMMAQVKDNDSVAGLGMKINDDGTASYFAVFNKNMKENKERLEAAQQKAKTKKAEADKAAAKRADKKKEAERLERKKAEALKEQEDDDDDEVSAVSEEDILKANEIDWESGDYETITADSVEELMDKIGAYTSFYGGQTERAGSFLDIQA